MLEAESDQAIDFPVDTIFSIQDQAGVYQFRYPVFQDLRTLIVLTCAAHNFGPLPNNSMNTARNTFGHLQYRRTPATADIEQPISQSTSREFQQVADRLADAGQRYEISSLY